MQKKQIRIMSLLLALLMALSSYLMLVVPVTVQAASKPSVEYRTHVQTYGWQNYVKDGALAGTTGQSKRLEGINIRLANLSGKGGVTYRTHVQTYGWQEWKSNGVMSGTQGEAKRLEAIQIKLTGDVANKYDIYYQAHIQHVGWTGWAKNGEMCGSAGLSYRMEAMRIKLVAKGSAAPGNVGNIFIQKNEIPSNGAGYFKGSLIKYASHVQSIGWQNYVVDGKTSGTTGQAKRVEAIRISLTNVPYSGGVSYNAHVQGIGWQGWKSNGTLAGTTGQARRIEAIQIKLTGKIASYYDVYYRTHCQGLGWTSWVKNGALCGTAKGGRRMEAYEVRLVRKGTSAPSSPAGSVGYQEYKNRMRNLFIGDSRGCCMSNEIIGTHVWTNTATLDSGWVGTNRFIAQWGGNTRGWAGNRTKEVLEKEDMSNTNIFITIGANEITDASRSHVNTVTVSEFIAEVVSRSKRWSNVHVYWCTMGPWQGPPYGQLGNYPNFRDAFNNGVNYSGATKVDPWNKIGKISYTTKIAGDGHYDGPTSRAWYNFLISSATQSY